MAQSIGSLVVRLGLDAAEFVTGLSKSEAEAKRFAKQLDSGIAFAANAAGVAIGAIAIAATAAFAAVDQLTKQAAHFKDLEETTGANAEALASFAVSAGTAGTSMDTIATASIKLTKSLTGVDDESKAAGAALVALGLPVKAFKALDPASQIEAVSKALGGFEDGAAKTAVAVALFGKAGAELLPFLKQLNEDGGRNVILTQAQIEAADAYADRQARLKTLISLYGQAIVTEALKPTELFTQALIESITKTGNLGDSIKAFAADGTFREWFNDAARAIARGADAIVDWGTALSLTIDLIKTGGQQIAGLGQQLRGLDRLTKGDFASGMADIREGFSRMTNAGAKWVADLRDAANRTTILARLNQKINENNLAGAFDDGSGKPKRPKLNFDGPAGKDGAARAERQSDAERYLETLRKQLQATFELSAVEKVTLDLMSGRLKLSNGVTEEQLLDVARAIDKRKEEIEASKELAKTLEAEARAREQAGKLNRQQEEAAIKERDKILESNEALRDEIAIITGGEAARKAIEKARLSSAIALKEDTAAQLENAGASQIEIDAIRAQIAALKDRQGLLGQKDFAEALAADAQRIKDINQQFADSFASNVVDVVNGTKTIKDALKSFEKDVVSIISRIAANNIADALFGGQKGGGAFNFGSIIQSLFGSSTAATGPQGFGTFFNFSGIGAANGGDIPAGKASLVGERGPELFVPKVAGTVIPNHKMGGGVTNITINVPPGTSRQSGEQIALHAGREISHVLRRRN